MRQCHFSLVRYVPYPVKGEFVNIGLIFIHGDSVAVRFTSNWERVRTFHKRADIGMLKALEGDLHQRLSQPGVDILSVLATLQQSCSNAVEFTAPKACLCAHPGRELQTLVRLYL